MEFLDNIVALMLVFWEPFIWFSLFQFCFTFLGIDLRALVRHGMFSAIGRFSWPYPLFELKLQPKCTRTLISTSSPILVNSCLWILAFQQVWDVILLEFWCALSFSEVDQWHRFLVPLLSWFAFTVLLFSNDFILSLYTFL